MSGDTIIYGGITKRGDSYLRALVRSKKGGLKERFFYMTIEKSISKKKPVAAVARRLAELMYVLMRDGAIFEA
jgi:DNA-binding sugar fermentation-stimulating protein